MVKAALSSGGGGSHGKAMNWQDALVVELAGPEIPADALTAADIIARLKAKGVVRCLEWARKSMDYKVKAGEWRTAVKGNRRYYWPAGK